ncbi:MAG: hypothetical protein CM1200mP16_15360 [Nitrospina sp.]|nr:MAG: hypothetical protein CM1200mP16_15360 [Nitrospina sp.]
MGVKVRVPTPLMKLTKNKSEVTAEAQYYRNSQNLNPSLQESRGVFVKPMVLQEGLLIFI